jgi:molybdate transport system substrate-binding protein
MNPKTLRDATRIGALALAAGLAAALAGCGSGQPSGPASIPDPAPASQIGGDLTVYAAASLEPAFEQIGDWFVDEHPDVSIEFSYDGSSVLATQILSGAPVDVFTSADAPNMEKITSEARPSPRASSRSPWRRATRWASRCSPTWPERAPAPRSP